MLRKIPIRVGVTGGVGSGKSYVCHLLEQQNYPVFYTDKEAKLEMNENVEIQHSLSLLLGKNVMASDGQIDKGAMFSYISKGKEYAENVNRIVHPVVRKRMLDWLDRQHTEVAFVECALLFESGYSRDMDYVLLITAPLETRILRVMKRDNRSEASVRQLVELQCTEQEKKERSDYVIENDGVSDINAQLAGFRRFLGL